MKKTLFFAKLFIGLLIACVIAVFIVLKILFGVYDTPESIKKEFSKNYKIIAEITTYIEKSGYENVNIQNTDYIYDDGKYGTWYIQNNDVNDVKNNGVKNIEDTNIINTLSYLFKSRKYQVINKNGNTISFQLWSNLDAGSGFAYSIDGSEPTLQFLTKLESLEKEKWYYYEQDFNKWKQLPSSQE